MPDMVYEPATREELELLSELLTTAYFGMIEKYDDILMDIDMSNATVNQLAIIDNIASYRKEIQKCL